MPVKCTSEMCLHGCVRSYVNICTKFPSGNSRPPIFCLHSVLVVGIESCLKKYKLDLALSQKSTAREDALNLVPLSLRELDCFSLSLSLHRGLFGAYFRHSLLVTFHLVLDETRYNNG